MLQSSSDCFDNGNINGTQFDNQNRSNYYKSKRIYYSYLMHSIQTMDAIPKFHFSIF